MDRPAFDQKASWEYALSKTQAMAQHRERGGPSAQPVWAGYPAGSPTGQQGMPYGHGWGLRSPTAAFREQAADWPLTATSAEGRRLSQTAWQPMHQSVLSGPAQTQAGMRLNSQPSTDVGRTSQLSRSMSLLSLRTGAANHPGVSADVSAGPTAITRARSASLGRKGRKGTEKVTWEVLRVLLQKVPRYGFGIAVAGGRDNPHFASGDPSIAVSDVLKGGPAEGKLCVNDRVLSVNGVSLDNVEHAQAIALLRDGGNAVDLVVRRKAIDRSQPENIHTAPSTGRSAASTAAALGKVTLVKRNRRDEFGLVFGFKLYVKELTSGSLAARSGLINEDDVVLKINNVSTDSLSLLDAAKLVEKASSRGVGEKLVLHIKREPEPAAAASASIPRVASSLSVHKHPGDGVNATHPPHDIFSGMAGLPRSANEASSSRQKPDNEKPSLLGYSSSNETQQASEVTHSSNSGMGLPTDRVAGPAVEWRGKYHGLPNNTWPNDNRPDHSAPHPLLESPVQQQQQSQTTNRQQRQDYKGGWSPGAGEGERTGSLEDRKSVRVISFRKEGTYTGVGLSGGNATGVFVSTVLESSHAHSQGLMEGDQILEVDGCITSDMTREEVFLALTAAADSTQVTVRQAAHTAEYNHAAAAGGSGDLFHVRAHFKYGGGARHLRFAPDDLLRVTDTLVGDEPGEWMAEKLEIHSSGSSYRPYTKVIAKGLIPNAMRASELAAARDYPMDDDDDEGVTGSKPTSSSDSASKSGLGGIFKRKGTSPKEKSCSKTHFEDVILGNTPTKFEAYERVALQKPGFSRPLVLFGCLADVARDMLCRLQPDAYEYPSPTASGAIHLSAVHEAMSRGKHCVLLAGPGAVRRLQRAQFAPIVVLLRADSKATAKELRERFSGKMPARKASATEPFERGVEVESSCPHLLSAVLSVKTSDSDQEWVARLDNTVAELQQNEMVWMGVRHAAQDAAARRATPKFGVGVSTECGTAALVGTSVQEQAPRTCSLPVDGLLAGKVERGSNRASDEQDTKGSGPSDPQRPGNPSSVWHSFARQNEGVYERYRKIEQSQTTDAIGNSAARNNQDAPSGQHRTVGARHIGDSGYERDPVFTHSDGEQGRMQPSRYVPPHSLQGSNRGESLSASSNLVFDKNSDYATISRLRANATGITARELVNMDPKRLPNNHGSALADSNAGSVDAAHSDRHVATSAAGASGSDTLYGRDHTYDARHRGLQAQQKAEPQVFHSSLGGDRNYHYGNSYNSHLLHNDGQAELDSGSNQNAVYNKQTRRPDPAPAHQAARNHSLHHVNPDNFWVNHNSFDAGPDGVLYHAVPLLLADSKEDSSPDGPSSTSNDCGTRTGGTSSELLPSQRRPEIPGSRTFLQQPVSNPLDTETKNERYNAVSARNLVAEADEPFGKVGGTASIGSEKSSFFTNFVGGDVDPRLVHRLKGESSVKSSL